ANQVLVQPDGDEDIFLTEPQYHAQNTLVYRIYGREFLDDLRSAGFEVEYATASSVKDGISHQGIIVCRKPIASASSSAPDDEVVATMKGDWNQRAVEDAKYYVHSTKRDQSEEEFDASGWDSVKSIVLDDLQTITGDTDPKTMRVLEIGCGLGRMTKHLAGVFGEVHGVDVSGEMIRGAKQRLKSVPNAFVYETNGKDLSLFADEMFDFAFSFIVFQHIPFKEVVINYIREAHRVLKRGGVFKFQVQGCVNPTWLAMPKDTWHGVTITEEDIDQLSAELGFELVRKWGQGTQYSWYILRKIAVPQQVELPQLSKPVVSIVIPVYNGLKLTQACLRSIAVNTEAPCYEVIVVDNASKDGTTEFLRQQTDPSIKAIFNDENKGFVEACNAGAAAASGDFVLFLNNDTEVQPGWLSALVGFASNTPDCGAVGSRLIYPNGRLQEAGGIIFSDGNGWNYGKGLSPTEPKFNFVREVDYCSGAALMVRKDLWDKIGGFDLRYAPAYYEDTDLCFEVRKRGYKVYYQPKSIVIHYEGQTAGTSLQEGFKRYQVENRHKFVEKWREELASQYANDPNNVVKASSRGTRGSVLVVDPFLPFFDQASGSLRLFQMLKILKQLGFHVTFIARNPLQESKYRPILEDLGIEVYAGDPAAMKAAGSRLDGVPPISYEVLFSERQFQYAIINFWHVAEAYIPVIRQYSPKTQIIVDTVDIHFLREMREAELKKSLQMIKKALANKRWEITTYRQADRLWVITEQDKQAVQDLLPDMRIDIVPNIHSQVAAVKRFEETSDLLFVGSFKHPPNADAVRFFCKEVFPFVLERIPDAKLFVVGANPPADIQNLASENVIVTGFVQDLSDYLLRARVSISPLRFGAGMKGKVGEALSWGLPVVTTSIGAEGMSLVHEQDALIADDPKSFAEQIIRLYKDRELWNRLSENGKARVAQWSPEAVKSHLDKLLDDPNPAPKPKLVSIVVLVWNQLEYTKKCLESVE
ncbi:MAG TPA: glycosyltransferase, partial [Armatimonadota bacterium]|nr:glycosyltransferase [Armatimonadota bacterium]